MSKIEHFLRHFLSLSKDFQYRPSITAAEIKPKQQEHQSSSYDLENVIKALTNPVNFPSKGQGLMLSYENYFYNAIDSSEYVERLRYLTHHVDRMNVSVLT
jgi:hypothetical protein